MTPQLLLSVLLSILLAGCSPPDPAIAPIDSSADPVSHRPPDPAILAKLQEIVDVRQRQVEAHQRLVEAGRAESDGLAEIALAEARIALAREQRQAESVVEELRKIVSLHERALEREEARDEIGQVAEIDRARVALLEAEVRLLREEQGLAGR